MTGSPAGQVIQVCSLVVHRIGFDYAGSLGCLSAYCNLSGSAWRNLSVMVMVAWLPTARSSLAFTLPTPLGVWQREFTAVAQIQVPLVKAGGSTAVT